VQSQSLDLSSYRVLPLPKAKEIANRNYLRWHKVAHIAQGDSRIVRIVATVERSTFCGFPSSYPFLYCIILRVDIFVICYTGI